MVGTQVKEGSLHRIKPRQLEDGTVDEPIPVGMVAGTGFEPFMKPLGGHLLPTRLISACWPGILDKFSGGRGNQPRYALKKGIVIHRFPPDIAPDG